MTKFNEALDFLEATNNTDISTIMDCAKCSETVANFALQAYKRDNRSKANKANKPKDEDKAQTSEDIRQDKVNKACQLYQDVCDTDIKLFKFSTSLGMDPQESIDKLTRKLEMATQLVELAEFVHNLKKDDSAS